MFSKDVLENRAKNGTVKDFKEYGLNVDYAKLGEDMEKVSQEASNYDSEIGDKMCQDYLTDYIDDVFMGIAQKEKDSKKRIEAFDNFSHDIITSCPYFLDLSMLSLMRTIDKQVKKYKFSLSSGQSMIDSDIEDIKTIRAKREKEKLQKGNQPKKLTESEVKQREKEKEEDKKVSKQVSELMDKQKKEIDSSKNALSGVNDRSSEIDRILEFCDGNSVATQDIDLKTDAGAKIETEIQNEVLLHSVALLSRMKEIHSNRPGFHPFDSHKEKKIIDKSFDKVRKQFDLSNEELNSMISCYDENLKSMPKSDDNLSRGYGLDSDKIFGIINGESTKKQDNFMRERIEIKLPESSNDNISISKNVEPILESKKSKKI
jgi:hypothetical protein